MISEAFNVLDQYFTSYERDSWQEESLNSFSDCTQ